jgi:hypothetical protein
MHGHLDELGDLPAVPKRRLGRDVDQVLMVIGDLEHRAAAARPGEALRADWLAAPRAQAGVLEADHKHADRLVECDQLAVHATCASRSHQQRVAGPARHGRVAQQHKELVAVTARPALDRMRPQRRADQRNHRPEMVRALGHATDPARIVVERAIIKEAVWAEHFPRLHLLPGQLAHGS